MKAKNSIKDLAMTLPNACEEKDLPTWPHSRAQDKLGQAARLKEVFSAVVLILKKTSFRIRPGRQVFFFASSLIRAYRRSPQENSHPLGADFKIIFFQKTKQKNISYFAKAKCLSARYLGDSAISAVENEAQGMGVLLGAGCLI